MQTTSENLKRELLEIFFAQSRIIWGTTIVVFVLALLIAFLWPPTYSSTGSILVRRKNIEKSPEALEEIQSQIALFRVAKEDLVSEMEIMVSPTLIEKTVKHLHDTKQQFGQNPGLAEKLTSIFDRQKISTSAVTDPALAEEVFRIKKNLATEIIPASNVIKVTYYSKDPDEAVIVLNAHLKQYTVFRNGVLNPAKEPFFAKQADRYRNDLEKIEDAQLDLIKQTGVTEPDKEIDNNLLLKSQLVQNLSQLEQDAIAMRLYVKRLEDALASDDVQFFAFIDGLAFVELRTKLEDLYIERGEALRHYLETSSKVRAIDQQLKDTSDAMKAEIRAFKDTKQTELETILDKIDTLEKRIADLDLRNMALKKQLYQAKRLGYEADLLASSYETFAKRREETSIQARSGDATSAISLLHSAFPSEGPVFPKKGILIPFGLLVGFVTGCCLGFIAEYMDHTFKKASDVNTYTDLPLIFSIKRWN